MDFIRKILSLITGSEKHDTNGMINFVYQMEEDFSERIITVHYDSDGMIIFSIFSPEEWSMINDISELSGSDIEDIVREVAQDNNVATITIDPTEFP